MPPITNNAPFGCSSAAPFRVRDNRGSESDTSLDFEVEFQNPANAGSVLAYEWFLNGLKVDGTEGQTMVATAPLGQHTVGARMLLSKVWTGVSTRPFLVGSPLPYPEISDGVNALRVFLFKRVCSVDHTSANVSLIFTDVKPSYEGYLYDLYFIEADGSVTSSLQAELYPDWIVTKNVPVGNFRVVAKEFYNGVFTRYSDVSIQIDCSATMDVGGVFLPTQSDGANGLDMNWYQLDCSSDNQSTSLKVWVVIPLTGATYDLRIIDSQGGYRGYTGGNGSEQVFPNIPTGMVRIYMRRLINGQPDGAYADIPLFLRCPMTGPL